MIKREIPRAHGYQCPAYRLGVCVNRDCHEARECALCSEPLVRQAGDVAKEIVEGLRG